MAARFDIVHEVPKKEKSPSHWILYFQYGNYIYDDGRDSEDGFRFIWRRPDGSLQAARGQARIPNETELLNLIDLARKDGWFK